MEASANSIDYYGSGNPKNNKTYGNLHNDGHIHYFIRVQNLSDQPQDVTVRIFMAPETHIDDRSSWI